MGTNINSVYYSTFECVNDVSIDKTWDNICICGNRMKSFLQDDFGDEVYWCSKCGTLAIWKGDGEIEWHIKGNK